MNKIQMIELLAIRGIISLEKGTSVADAIRDSGGEPTLEEMVKANEGAMKHFIVKLDHQIMENNKLIRDNKVLQKAKDELDALHEAGVNNWEGYEDAMDSLNPAYHQCTKCNGVHKCSEHFDKHPCCGSADYNRHNSTCINT